MNWHSGRLFENWGIVNWKKIPFSTSFSIPIPDKLLKTAKESEWQFSSTGNRQSSNKNVHKGLSKVAWIAQRKRLLRDSRNLARLFGRRCTQLPREYGLGQRGESHNQVGELRSETRVPRQDGTQLLQGLKNCDSNAIFPFSKLQKSTLCCIPSVVTFSKAFWTCSTGRWTVHPNW